MQPIYVLCVLLAMSIAHVHAGFCFARCPSTEEVVWALEPANGRCNAFRNKCYFNRANLGRDPGLNIVTKKQCQKKCNEVCTKIYIPVWASYNGTVKEFSNECLLNVHVCTTGETYLPVKMQ
ncbi:uncharacterized protein LOC115621520 [Scaptodrosophila lebanonensis]|uniref:Uncharacterized protein LOC115621520 n=1 Tax=Drosophila lebanonensis TaxID=7225 RepID=A0A6J2T6Y0_DROLE|nr:uncharacterized protein LOC115621520 [Scaptodrosophila lebanonensis]